MQNRIHSLEDWIFITRNRDGITIEDTVKKLKYVASSLKICDNPHLQSFGYRRINFQQHRYFMLYRIENDVVYVDDIFHELQDYENRMI